MPHVQPSYNRCPTQAAPVLAVRDQTLGFFEMRWGLVPKWAKSIAEASKYSLINARFEEIENKPSYRQAFKNQRGIIPVSGFYEWHREGNQKTPYAISLVDQPIMSFAGIWETWADPKTGEVVDSFSVVTIPALGEMAKVHDRMPLVLQSDEEEAWLDPKNKTKQELSSFASLRQCPTFKIYPISSRVNSPKNNSADLLDILAE
jgi:putative SOS response-associated peptidase YedK